MVKRTKQEIEHFSNLGHIWWGAKTVAGQKRYDSKARLFRKYCRPKKAWVVLEIGCGDGELTKRIADGKIKITATDVTPTVINRAKNSLKLPRVEFTVKNAEKLDYDDNSIDVVCGISILHHLNTEKALEEAYRVLKPDGRLFFTEPNLVNPLVFLGLNLYYLRKKMEFSPGETALLRWNLSSMLKRIGFRKVVVKNYDFLFPLTPPRWVNMVSRLSDILEVIPLVKEMSGSLLIYAVK
ncbi:hypothetical protein A2875_00625 [Candidatus Gottesmanbacteria bacterium RIFCSPHIGHO2_01_FULL_46_14]|uniref:Methyltransferase type 11 domain-containing protein n=1 Tax=Candidatus Gottesmanbacteria bacterium RIFCSPHIGHO2_01_FULL_46_14 TaxID=1798380 RepID=A0A1F5ZT28_9BACT|nr:MAG: hypothetical protein A2875_00625 [Candidatus Gottesmanbacteria bacterium RIFCSPHIGHO2_01_FULL_46_14]